MYLYCTNNKNVTIVTTAHSVVLYRRWNTITKTLNIQNLSLVLS